MQMIEVSKLKSHPRNNEFFDDIQDDKWEDFKKSIQRRGVIEAITVTQDLVIVSGHQRVRACRELNKLQIPCRTVHYDDYNESTSNNKEDLILEDLISTNILQRGIGNINPMKMAKCIVELERIYDIKNGGDRKSNNIRSDRNNFDLIKTQKNLAENIGIDQRQLSNYKKLLSLIPELQEMVESEEITPTVAYSVWAKLSPEDQGKLFEKIGKDKITELTQKETQKYIDEINKIKQEKLEGKIKSLEKENDILGKEKKELQSKINKMKGNNKETTQECQDLNIKLKEVIDEKEKLEWQLIPLREQVKKEEYFSGFKLSTSLFLDATAKLVFKHNELKNLPPDEKQKFYDQIVILEKCINDIKQILN
jgi:ParB-like chromosome segregation protein Spo0J